ncbi:pyrroline-5-carboxylate reductase [Legionella lansingensis]|uniref:Pyrroline-5-carboxylate reductase n=1 Tax=Legionella lansingensis TaxID=45067 RepID=A0A0W0VUM8_9GAMM|nr:pyrroline-5-carboxylate reductase [Legionella lansingensis]KTD23736.1 pyrroline-5-carboxylate reductase [Legionella lansingensis]SNV47605.1 pyrroline-5-carboxylate reductase [Legionella lansingensis]
MKISFIGFGNMAQAIARSLIHKKEYQLFAASPSLSKGINAEGIVTDSDNFKIIEGADVIILAVKPSKINDALSQIARAIPPQCLLISVAAGVSLASLEKYCRKDQAIIRSMPNTPIAVGKGATPLIANSKVTQAQRQLAESLFQNAGIVCWANVEAEIDAFTALSGSGPAYVFLFMEAMIEGAEKLGLSQEIAKKFSLQTIAGALSLALSSHLDISELRAKVTSPSGTTAAALTTLEEKGFRQAVIAAMKAAYERAKQLNL